jgi:hypothetical protein
MRNRPNDTDSKNTDPRYLQMTSQNVWNMSLFEHFFNVLGLYLEFRIRIRIEVKGTTLKPHQSDKQDADLDPHQSYKQDPDRDPHQGSNLAGMSPYISLKKKRHYEHQMTETHR